MFGMKKTSELDRLRAVYADQTDSELLRLCEDRDGLTDAARQALDEVMQQRELKEHTGDDAAALSHSQISADKQNSPAEGLSSDEAELWTFADTYQLQALLDLLEESGILFRLLDASKVQRTGLRSRNQIGVTVIVKRAREQEAKAALRQVLFASGLDHEEPSELALTPPTNLVLLLTCGRADALGLVHALSEAGISFYWRDGREDIEVPGEEVIAFEVHAGQRERADEAVQGWMASRPAEDEETAAADA